jgi:hypothetical protein
MSKSAQNISIASHQNNELSSIQKLGLTLGFIDFYYDISSLMSIFQIKQFGLLFPCPPF